MVHVDGAYDSSQANTRSGSAFMSTVPLLARVYDFLSWGPSGSASVGALRATCRATASSYALAAASRFDHDVFPLDHRPPAVFLVEGDTLETDGSAAFLASTGGRLKVYPLPTAAPAQRGRDMDQRHPPSPDNDSAASAFRKPAHLTLVICRGDASVHSERVQYDTQGRETTPVSFEPSVAKDFGLVVNHADLMPRHSQRDLLVSRTRRLRSLERVELHSFHSVRLESLPDFVDFDLRANPENLNALRHLSLSHLPSLIEFARGLGYESPHLRSVVLDDLAELRDIGCKAFSGCPLLESVTIRRVPRLRCVETRVMASCHKLRSVVLDGVPRLVDFQYSVFLGCTALRNLVIRPDAHDDPLAGDRSRPSDDLSHIEFAGLTHLKNIGAGFVASASLAPRVSLSSLPSLEHIGDTVLFAVRMVRHLVLCDLPALVVIGGKFGSECHQLHDVALDRLPRLRTLGEDFLSECPNLARVRLSGCTSLRLIGHNFIALSFMDGGADEEASNPVVAKRTRAEGRAPRQPVAKAVGLHVDDVPQLQSVAANCCEGRGGPPERCLIGSGDGFRSFLRCIRR